MSWLEAHALALAALAGFAARYDRMAIAAGACALALADSGAALAPPWPYSALWACLGAPVSLGLIGELCDALPRRAGVPAGLAVGGSAWGLIYMLGEWLGKTGFAVAALALYSTAILIGGAWWLWRLRASPLTPWRGGVEALALIGTLAANCTGWIAYACGGTLRGSVLVDILGCVAIIGAIAWEAADEP